MTNNLRFADPLKASFTFDGDGIGGAVIVSAKQLYFGSTETGTSKHCAARHGEEVEDVFLVCFPGLRVVQK